MAAVTASSPPDLLPKVERPPIALTGSLILRSLYPTPGNPVMPRPSSVTSTNQRQGASLQIWREGMAIWVAGWAAEASPVKPRPPNGNFRYS